MSKQFCIVTYNSNSAETGYLDNNIIINGLYLLLLVCMQGVREKIIVYKMGALLLIKGKKSGTPCTNIDKLMRRLCATFKSQAPDPNSGGLKN